MKSTRVLSQGILILGSMILFIWYFLTPDQRQTYLEYLPVPLGVVQGSLLTLMVVALMALVCPAYKLSKRNNTLQQFLEVEIEKRHLAEKELARAQEITQTGTWVLDVSGQRMQWSSEVFRILDCGSMNAEMNLQRFLKSVHPMDRELVQKEIQQAIQQGRAFNLAHRVVHQDGSIRFVKQRSEIFMNEKGDPVRILGTLHDVTDLKEAENLAARLSRIIDRSFNEVYTFDGETLKFTQVNLAGRLNLRYTTEELYEMTPLDLLPEVTPEQLDQLIASLREGIESVTAFESVHKKKNGTLYPVDIRLQISNTESRPQFVAIIQDISDRKRVGGLFSKIQQELDKRVREKTLGLTQMNNKLQEKIDKQQAAIDRLESRVDKANPDWKPAP